MTVGSSSTSHPFFANGLLSLMEVELVEVVEAVVDGVEERVFAYCCMRPSMF